jgi:hypothetical protein
LVLTLRNPLYNQGVATVEITIREVLQEAESRLRQLISDAAKLGDYEGVDLARHAAARVREIGEYSPSDQGVHSAQGSIDDGTELGPSTDPPRQTRQKRGKEYPRFFVEGDVLHKVGWSKKDREEYVHKIPKAAYELIVRAIGEVSRSGRKLVTSDELERRLGSNDPPVPVYQIYVTFALLRTKHLIEKKGRKGYRTVGDIVGCGLQVWPTLETAKASKREPRNGD